MRARARRCPIAGCARACGVVEIAQPDNDRVAMKPKRGQMRAQLGYRVAQIRGTYPETGAELAKAAQTQGLLVAADRGAIAAAISAP